MGVEFPFGVMKMFCKSAEIVAQHCECIKCHGIVH